MTAPFDRKATEATIRTSLDIFFNMATDQELWVFGNLFELQVRKAVFLRTGHTCCKSQEELEAYHQSFIREQEAVVTGLLKELDDLYRAGLQATVNRH